jgi:hypothetical protein
MNKTTFGFNICPGAHTVSYRINRTGGIIHKDGLILVLGQKSGGYMLNLTKKYGK